MSPADIACIRFSANCKLNSEACRPDPNLRLILGHLELLDPIMAEPSRRPQAQVGAPCSSKDARLRQHGSFRSDELALHMEPQDDLLFEPQDKTDTEADFDDEYSSDDDSAILSSSDDDDDADDIENHIAQAQLQLKLQPSIYADFDADGGGDLRLQCVKSHTYLFTAREEDGVVVQCTEIDDD